MEPRHYGGVFVLFSVVFVNNVVIGIGFYLSYHVPFRLSASVIERLKVFAVFKSFVSNNAQAFRK